MVRLKLLTDSWLLRLIITLICQFSTLLSQPTPIIVEGFPKLIEADPGFNSWEGPSIADLDQDGDLEIILASGSQVHVIQHDGRALPGWPQTTTYQTHNSPAVGDIDADGVLDIVTFDRNGPARKSFLYAWNAAGSLLTGFPIALELGNAAITLYDLDGDRGLEIIASFGGKTYAFNHAGAVLPGWPQDVTPFYALSKVAVGDINADNKPEIVVASQYITQPDRRQSLGRLHIWDAQGNILPGWPVTTPKGYVFTVLCNPILVDINRDGFLEIAVGTHSTLPSDVGFAALYRYDGTSMPGWPQHTAGPDSLVSIGAAPAVADIDADGELELIFGDLFDHVVAWESDGTLVSGWPVSLKAVDSTLVFRSIEASPAVGDVDGDNLLEIFINNNQANLVEGQWLGRVYAFHHDGSSLAWSPLYPREFASNNTVALADLQNDGNTDIVIVSDDRETWLTVWTIPGVPYIEERFPWPMFGHDRWHTSQYGFKPPDEPAVNVSGKEAAITLPKEFALHPNFPNPFNPQTTIAFTLPTAQMVTLKIYDLSGQEIQNLVQQQMPAGTHRLTFDGRGLVSGVYLYRMETGKAASHAHRSATRKMLLLR
ncbi:T9SS type A sorting domain-containing protein [bacterium]|nr:T9SS type A sorting domain-containing protein [bacterium]